jgi:GH25 family lysozyme M1 (1,4-beta-N-acetylmuramidase)
MMMSYVSRGVTGLRVVTRTKMTLKQSRGAMTETQRGIDVSHWQNPTALDWSRVRETHEFAIIRATYGITPDRRTAAFVKGARRAAMRIGLYHFFKADEDPTAQFVAFAEVAQRVHMQAGDIRPTIDVEAFPIKGSNPRIWVQPKPSWVPKVDELNEQFADNWGGDSIHYLNGHDWLQLGKPLHWRTRPLWLAHWGVSVPVVPDGWDWSLWQTGADRMDAYRITSSIDQNIGRKPLPMIPHEWMTDSERAHIEGVIAMTLREGGSE